jgi:DNA primase large subunit
MAVRRAPPLAERDLFVAYPFLPGADTVVNELAVSLRQLLEDDLYGRARELGRYRIRAAVDDPTGTTRVGELDRATGEERYLSFLYSWVTLSAFPTRAPLRRWAVAEAKRSFGRLRSAPAPELVEVAQRLGYQFDPDPGGIRVALADYLRLAVPIREAAFRLVRQDLRRGQVQVTQERAARILQEGIRLRLTEPFELEGDLRTRLEGAESDLIRETLARVPQPIARAGSGPPTLRTDLFPPCIRKMRRMLESGENLSHAGRFALAAFLYRAGADNETMVDAYRGAPDFDESITRYQIEHITLHDQGRGYEPPECNTLRSHSLCFRDGDPTASRPEDRGRDPICFAPTLRHPLQYYRIRGGRPVERGPPVPTT